jgi:hypothetical protein
MAVNIRHTEDEINLNSSFTSVYVKQQETGTDKGIQCNYLLIRQKDTLHISIPVMKYSREICS